MNLVITSSEICQQSSPDVITVLWDSYNTADRIISLPRIVDEYGKELRKEYLSRLEAISNYKLDGNTVASFFSISDKFNYWQSSSLLQRFNAAEFSEIIDVIKILALERYILPRYPNANIILGDKKITQLLSKNKENNYVVRTFAAIYILESVLFFIVKIISRYIYFRLKKKKNLARDSNIIFFDVLAHVGNKHGNYQLGYWGDLEKRMKEWNIPAVWMHSYLKSPEISSYSKANSIIENCQLNTKSNDQHFLTDSFINESVLLNSIRYYLKLIKQANRFVNFVINNEIPIVGKVIKINEFYPLLKSLYGRGALDYCFRYSLFEEIFSNFNGLKKIFYIYENQPWEHALLFAVSKKRSVVKFGVAHSTVRPWDLRYHEVCNIKENTTAHWNLKPDKVVVNSENAKNVLRESVLDSSKIIVAEALRFNYIEDIRKNYTKEKSKYRVIVFCDYAKTTTDNILDWVEKFQNTSSISSYFEFEIKEHPAYKNLAKDFPGITKSNTKAALEFNDVAITSSLSSSAIESSEVGLKVIQILDPKSFNFSLSGDNSLGICKVKSYKEFLREMINIATSKNYFNGEKKYFCFSRELTYWHKVLLV